MPRFKESKPYERPEPGDVFQREQQDGRWEVGVVLGVSEQRNAKGDVLTWKAVISTGFREFREDVRHDKSYDSSESWHPKPGTVSQVEMSKVLTGLAARVTALEEILSRPAPEAEPVPVAPPEPVARPRRGVAA